MWNGEEKKKEKQLFVCPRKYRAGVHGGLSTCGGVLGTGPPSVLAWMRSWAKTRDEVMCMEAMSAGSAHVCSWNRVLHVTNCTGNLAHWADGACPMFFCFFAMLIFRLWWERERVALGSDSVIHASPRYLTNGNLFNRPCMYGLISYLFFSVGEWDVAAVLLYCWFIFILAHCKYNI